MKLSLSRKYHFSHTPFETKKYCILFLIFSYFSGIGAGFLKEQIFAFSNESTSARPSPVNQNSVTSIPQGRFPVPFLISHFLQKETGG